MNIMEITNLLLKKLYQSNLDVELELDIDEIVSDSVQVQINVKPKYFNDFSIFYGTKDTKINFSSIFEVGNNNVVKAEELFKENKGIFDDFIYDDEDEFIHLFGEMEVEQFYTYDKYRLDDYVIEEIIKYLQEEHELTNYLNTTSEQGDTYER